MRVLIATLATLVSWTALAQDADLGDAWRLGLQRLNADELRLKFRSNEVMDQICKVAVTDVAVTVGTREEAGVIHLATDVSRQHCTAKEGRWFGFVDLSLALDQIAPGMYEIQIDGVTEGFLKHGAEGTVGFRERNDSGDDLDPI